MAISLNDQRGHKVRIQRGVKMTSEACKVIKTAKYPVTTNTTLMCYDVCAQAEHET